MVRYLIYTAYCTLQDFSAYEASDEGSEGGPEGEFHKDLEELYDKHFRKTEWTP